MDFVFCMQTLFYTGILTQKWAMVLTSKVFWIMWSGQSRNFLPVTIPALLTRISTSPTSLFTYKLTDISFTGVLVNNFNSSVKKFINIIQFCQYIHVFHNFTTKCCYKNLRFEKITIKRNMQSYNDAPPAV